MKIKIIILILGSFLLTQNVLAQKSSKKILITGMVTDTQAKPINGAMIFVDNYNSGQVTNSKGIYKVKVNPGADSLRIMTLTNDMSNVAIEGRTTINFTLSASFPSQQDNKASKAGEQEVNIGYGKVKQKNLLSPVSTIDGSTGKYARYKDIYEILKTIPGVRINGRSVKIQGQTSINSGADALIIVDGMTVESIDDISPSLVENISVLKGASASIYGVRGANGVILITLFGAQKRK